MQYTVIREPQKLREKAQWLSWLERRPVTAEVVGSSPIWVAFERPVFAQSCVGTGLLLYSDRELN